MRHTQLSFSKLFSIAYDTDTRILEIKFRDGILQQYFDVPSTIYFSLLNAYSHDSYFDKYISSIYPLSNVAKG